MRRGRTKAARLFEKNRLSGVKCAGQAVG